MLIKKIKYTDYMGEEREEEFFFNLNKAEISKLLISTDGDYTLDKYLENLMRRKNGKEIMDFFDMIIMTSYGEMSPDGKKFDKSEEAKSHFRDTEAYSELFMELISDGKKATDFMKGIMPKNLVEEIKKIVEDNPDAITDEMKDYLLN